MILRFEVKAQPEIPEPFLADQARLLEKVAIGVPLREVLEATAKALEAHCEGLRCSIHLVAAGGAALELAAAPSLPAELASEAASVPIGPGQGACGTAAHRRARVIVADTFSDPLFAPYREVAAAHGLRACWSTPVLDADERLLGTVAAYLGEPRGPEPREQSLIDAVTHLVAIAAQRERWRDAVRASEARLQAIIDTEPECVKLVSPDGRLLDINPAGLAMIGADAADQVLGQPVLDMIDPRDRERYWELHRRACAGGRGVVEFRVQGLAGGSRWMESHSAPLRDESDRVTAVLSVTRDIDRRKRSEELATIVCQAVEAASDGIGIADAAGRSIYHNRAFVELLGHTAEDLNALGGPRAAYADPALYRQVLAAIRRGESWDGDARLVDKQRRVRELHLRAAPIRDEAGNVVAAVAVCSDLSERRRLELQAREAQRLEGIESLAGGIAHELNNVLAPITLALAALRRRVTDSEASRTLATIEDSATRGAELVRQIFLLGRVGTGNEAGPLRTAEIVEAIAGRARELASRSADGDRDAAALAPETAAPTLGAATTEPRRLRTLLVVDDEPALLEIAKETLEELGYRVLAASDGREALAMFRENRARISLVLTDMMMPGVDGPELIGRLHEIEPGLPVVGTSGWPVQAHKLPPGALRGFLPKPYTAEALGRTIQAALGA